MTSLGPFGIPHSLDGIGFPHQGGMSGMWGKYRFQVLVTQLLFIAASQLPCTLARVINPNDIR